MTAVRLLDAAETAAGPRQQRGALSLARRLPQLMVAARDVAATVMHGVHGRRRAGAGETFWQFRPFVQGESVANIDWRRSARDDRLYIKEREWEAAHTVWLWLDRSASMRFVSDLAPAPKIDRALVLGLACADLLVRGGERVGLAGLTRALATRGIISRLGEALLDEERRAPAEAAAELPPAAALGARAQAVLISDFLSPPAETAAVIAAMAGRGALGHVVMIADPAEETFPFSGHTEFLDVDSPARLRVGDAASLRAAYTARLAGHRDALRAACARHGWSFALHRTDRPAAQALLALRVRLENSAPAFAGAL